MKLIYLWLVSVCVLAIVPDIRAQQIVAYYDFNGNAKDVSSNQNNSAIHGATLTQDRFGIAGKAFQFSGNNSYLVAPNSPQLQSPTITVSFWVRADEIPAQGEVYILSNGGWQERWKISLPNHGKPIWTTHAVSCCSDLDAGTPLQVGVWTHLVMVHDGAKDKIYLNGSLANQRDYTGDLGATLQPLGFGYSPVDNNYFFKGALDEVTIYDGALDSAAIVALYDAQSIAPPVVNELVANYTFSDNLLDESVYANNAKGSNTSFVTDRFGFGSKAVTFNGTDASVTATNSSVLNSATTTVSFWINAASLPASGEVYIASFGGWQDRWKISLPAHGKMVWTTHATSCCSDLDAGGGNELVVGKWVHAVFVHDGTMDRIFINGVFANERPAPGDLNTTTHPLGIGYDPIDVNYYFNGSIDEFQVYNYALSDLEIGALYTEQNTAVINPDPLVANLTFSGDFKDASQFGNDVASTNAQLTYDRHGYPNNALAITPDDAVNIVVPNSKQYNSDWASVSFWVKMNELPASGEVYLLSFGGWQERWKISLPSHGKVVWTTYATSCCSDMDAGDGHALIPGQWMHVVAVHGTGQDKIYINGEPANSKDVGGALHHTTHPLGIGWNPIDGDNVMNGDIDEVRIYTNPLTDQDVMNLYAEQNAPPVIAGDIVADYGLDANAKDDSPYHNLGDVSGAVASADRFGRANHSMNFNGSAGITADNSPALNTPVTSVSFWVNPNSLPASGEAYLLSFGGWQDRWKISLPSHGKAVWTTHATSCCSDLDAGGTNVLVPGTWTHLVMVHDGARDYIYFNGNLANQRDAPGDLNTTSHPLGIGYDPIDVANYFDGKLDDVQIYNTALDATAVAALYAEQNADPGETDVVAPCPPINLAGTVDFTRVTLTWQPAVDDDSGIANYNVYLGSFLNQTTEETTALISGLAPLTEYEFGVSAVDLAGNESDPSWITLTSGMDETPDTTAPSTPINLVVNAGATSAVFSWDPSTDDTAVEGYVVFVDGVYLDSLEANTTSIFVGGLDPSTLYTFEVYAFDLSGNDSEVAFITESTTEPIETAEPGLVAHYKFEGDANDATPYNNHGTIGGNPTFETVTGHPFSDMAIVLDGDSDSIFVANAVQLISDYTTVSFWIRLDGQNLNDAEAYVLDFGHYNQRWKISLPQHKRIVWTTHGHNAQFPDLTHDMDAKEGNELLEGFWFYVTMVHDGADDIIYLDGEEVNRQPFATILNSTARPFIMGSDAVEGRRYFNGGLDEVKIYNKALTSAEVLDLYESGATSVRELQEELNQYVEILYPNPTEDQLLIKHCFDSGQDLLIRIFDQLGRQVGDKRISAQELASGIINLNVANLQAGMYSLNFVRGGIAMGSMPFVKQ